MTDYKLVPVEPTPKMLEAYCDAQPSNIAVYLSDGVEPYKAMLAAAPAQQMEPVSAQVRYRRPEKGQPDWSVWQPAPIMLNRPHGEIDSRGWEVEYRLLYTTPQPAKKPTFTVGTDLSDGKLTVVVVKHEANISWVIHTEVIHLAEQTEPVRSPRTEDTTSTDSNSEQEQFTATDMATFCAYCGGNDEEPQDHCMDCTRPEQQPVGVVHLRKGGGISMLQVELNTPLHPGTKLYTAPQPAPDVTQLVEALGQAERERDFLITEYERAVGCGAQGFAHAAGHLFNAITNAKADINTEHFLALRDERDALKAKCEKLVEALKAAQKEAVYGLNHARTNIQASAALGRVSAVCDVALAAYRKQGEK